MEIPRGKGEMAKAKVLKEKYGVGISRCVCGCVRVCVCVWGGEGGQTKKLFHRGKGGSCIFSGIIHL